MIRTPSSPADDAPRPGEALDDVDELHVEGAGAASGPVAKSRSSDFPASRLDNFIAYQLRRAQEASFAAFASRVGRSTIWPGWFALLTIIHDEPFITQTALCGASMRDKSTLSSSLRQLINAGLVQRDRDPADARRYRLWLTPAGVEHLEALRVHAAAHDRRLDEIVGAKNKPLLLSLLMRISDELEQ